MPATYNFLRDVNVIHTRLTGRVTDGEIVGYYQLPELQRHQGPWREVVDGQFITEMVVTPAGQERLADLVTLYADRMRGARVAMVAGSALACEVFRAWQAQRADLGYEVRVFYSFHEALAWASAPEEPSTPPRPAPFTSRPAPSAPRR